LVGTPFAGGAGWVPLNVVIPPLVVGSVLGAEPDVEPAASIVALLLA
jgi:hypothetical protein